MPDFRLNGQQPQRLKVADVTPGGDATRVYAVVADYGWAEQILCSGSQRVHANGIAFILGEYLQIPIEPARAPEVVAS